MSVRMSVVPGGGPPVPSLVSHEEAAAEAAVATGRFFRTVTEALRLGKRFSVVQLLELQGWRH